MNFKNFRDAVESQFNKMKKGSLYITNIHRDDVWKSYLDAFPNGTNKIYKEKIEYDCNSCKRFLKNIGNVVSIDKRGDLVSVWDIKVEGYYQEVADTLSHYVKSSAIVDVFLHKERTIGQASNNQLIEDGSIITWRHFSCVLPSEFIDGDKASTQSKMRQKKAIFGRGMRELNIESIKIVLDLIAQKSLYRGEEFERVLKEFLILKSKYNEIELEYKKDNFLWENFSHRASTLKNSVIGTLVEDLSNGGDITECVKSFETKVAPTNYQRSSAPVSKGMVTQAVEKINELGLEASLHRRFAIAKDVSINNVLFANRSTSILMKDSIESMLMQEVKPSVKSYDKIEEISIDEFIISVLPKVNSIEVLLENRHKSNLVSLIAPNLEEPINIFKWDNPFSWSYHGEIADASIKQKVKNAGGNIMGDLRVSLSWFNTDDLDIHLKEPDAFEVSFTQKKSPKSGATLDVDMNVNRPVRDAVENITWADKNKIKKGKHTILVNNYTSREMIDAGFVIEVEYLGEVRTFSYSKKIKGKDTLSVFDFEIKNNAIHFSNINKEVKDGTLSQKVWNIKSLEFQKVSMILFSPNHWDENEVGNKHHFFILDNCINPNRARGFYNEFLRNDLIPHRKVFELLADKMKCEEASEQLSGLGFSSTKRDELVCKVDGNFSRTLKIKF